jgi:hypothetical protein
MTAVMFPARASRLGQMIDLPGGLTIAEVLRQAEANLAPLRDPAMARIGEHVAALEGYDRETGDPAQAYALASAIIDCASLFDMDEVCAVAAGLCDLVQDATPERPFDGRMPALHARTLRLLLALPDEASEERRRLRDEIAAVVAHKRAGRSPSPGG